MADRIRKINKDKNTVNVLASTSLAANAQIEGIYVAADGTLYAADYVNHVIYKIYESGRVEGVLIGKLGVSGNVLSDGITTTGLTARINQPWGICVDASNNIYFVDQDNQRIKKVSPSGVVSVVAGGASGDTVGQGQAAHFNLPYGLCVDKSGVLYVADTGNNKIKKILTSGTVTSMAGVSSGFANGTGGAAQFNAPQDVAVDNQGNVYVADTGNNRIRKITESGVVTTLAGYTDTGLIDGSGIEARFNGPIRLAIDPSNQFLYVMDGATNHAIRRVEMSGKTTTFLSYNATGRDIAVDNSGNLYILESDI